MQGSSGQGGNQNGQKQQGGLSWTQSPSSAKPISQVGSPLMPKATVAQAAGNNNNAQGQKNQQNNSSSNANNNKKNTDERPGSGARTAGIFLAGVIVGLIIGWGWFSLGRDNDAATVATSTSPMTSSSSESAAMPATGGNGAVVSGTNTSGVPAPISTSGSDSLAISSTQTSGTQVAVSSISVDTPTWVVIYENANGKPGNILGAKMFFAADKSGTVDLLRGTVAGQTYFAGEYTDNGDHQFSKTSDTQVNGANGSQMLVQFTTR